LSDILETFRKQYDENGTITVPEELKVVEPSIPVGAYSSNDIVLDDNLYKIAEDYANIRFNIDEERGYSRKNLINKTLNNARGFYGGNSVRAINEIAFLNKLDPDKEEDKEKLDKVGKFYTMFEGMEGLFGETTVGEKLGALGDYTREAILDPVNLIGFGIGKATLFGGSKLATQVAQKKAMQIYKKNRVKALAKGATKEKADEVAKTQADKMWSRVMLEAAKKENNTIVKNRVLKNKAKGLQAFGTRQAWSEIGKITAVEAIASAGTAVAYENGLVRTTGKEAEYLFEGTMAAIGSTLVGGAMGGASVYFSRAGRAKPFGPQEKEPDKKSILKKVTETEELALPATDVIKPRKFIAGDRVANNLGEAIKARRDLASKGNFSWRKKTDLGRNLAAEGGYGDDFWETLLVGSDGVVELKDAGIEIKGLAQVLYEDGFTWRKRYATDTYSNWVSERIREIEPQQVKNILKKFEGATGVSVYTSRQAKRRSKSLNNNTGINKKLSDFTPDDFANSFAHWAKMRGKGLGAISRATRLNSGEVIRPKTKSDAAASFFTDPIDKVLGKLRDVGVSTEGVTAGQNRIIRLLVSAPSTSFLNLVGYGTATAINSASDVGLGLIYAGKGGFQKLIMNDNAKESLRIAGAYIASNRQRLRNAIDPNMTYDAYKSIAIKNPEEMRDLVRVLPGGIEDIDKIVREQGFNPNQTLAGDISENIVDFAQKMSFVKIQDVFTKSQEFIFQLDKQLRLDKNINQSFSKFFTSPDAAKRMNSDEYKKAVARATFETQKAIFSLSYKSDKGTLGQLAGFIEDARNIPGVGLLVPFGRFFNNTIAVMTDLSGVSAGMKLLKPESSPRELKDLAMRGAIGIGLATTLAENEKYYIEQGLDAFQRIDETTGAVINERFNFPISHVKAGARILARGVDVEFLKDGKLIKVKGNVPKGEADDIINTIGFNQLTRQLNQTADGFGDSVRNILTGKEDPTKAFGPSNIVSQALSGMTRALSPYNDLMGLARGDDFKVIDRKQGSKFWNNSLRYMDQFIGAVSGDLAPERFDAAMGDIQSDASKQLGIREVDLTYSSKVLNTIGRQNYLENKRTKVAIAGNRYNQIFHDLFERKAKVLSKSKSFKEGFKGSKRSLLENQTKMVDAALREANELTKFIMETGSKQISDFRLSRLLDLESKAKSIANVEKALDRIGGEIGGKEFKDLNLSEIQVLEDYIETQNYIDSINAPMN